MIVIFVTSADIKINGLYIYIERDIYIEATYLRLYCYWKCRTHYILV